MTVNVRARLAQAAIKVETTKGVDAIAGSPVANDWVTCLASMQFDRDETPSTVLTGSYDDLPPIPGGRRATINISLQMYGAGTASALPRWGRLLRSCRMEEVATATAIGAPTAAAAGTASTVTLASPFGTTENEYRGMPILLAGNPAAGSTDVVINYTSGRVTTLARTYNPVLSTSTTAQIPQNVLYRPISDDTVEATTTIYIYQDGLVHQAVGCSGTWSVQLTAGAPAVLTFTMRGLVVGQNVAAALPSTYTPITRRPPIWAAGMSQLNRTLAQCRSANWDMAVRTTYVDDPEASQGFGAPIITGAAPRITLDPMQHTTHSPTRATAYAAGTAVPFACQWGDTAGNRFIISCPSAQPIALNVQERGELTADAITLAPDTANATMFLAAY
jgi:hypothetical protein